MAAVALWETTHGIGVSRVFHLVLPVCDCLDGLPGDWKLVDSATTFGQSEVRDSISEPIDVAGVR